MKNAEEQKQYRDAAAAHFEETFLVPFSLMAFASDENLAAAQEAGISPEDFALALGKHYDMKRRRR